MTELSRQTQLPEWLESALPGALQRAEGLYQSGSPVAPAAPVAGFGGDTLAAMDMVRGLSGAPSTAVQPGLDAWQQTVSGGFLPDAMAPQLDAAYKAAERRIVPQIGSMFSQGGRYGSGAHQATLARELGGAWSDAFADLYNTERGRQQQALGMVPGLNAMMQGAEMLPIQALSGIGAAQDALAQAQMDAQYRSELSGLDQPARTFDEYLARLQGIAPFAPTSTTGTTMQEGEQAGSQTRPLYSNTAGSLLGGAAMAAPLLFGGGPFMAGGGGLLGLLGR